MNVDWSAVGSLATAGTLIVAVVVLGQQVRDGRRRQAEQVAAWPFVDEKRELQVAVFVKLANASAVPVWSLSAVIGLYDPYTDRFEGLHSERRSMLAPQSTALIHPTSYRLGTLALMQDKVLLAVELTFMDEAGRMWRRRAGGRLERRHARQLWRPWRRRALDEGDYLYRPPDAPPIPNLDELLALPVVNPTTGEVEGG